MYCDACGQRSQVTQGQPCPSCGHSPDGKSPFEQSPWASPASPASTQTEAIGIPWEQESSFQSMLETVYGVLFDPVSTFAGAGKMQSIGPSLIYLLALGTVGGVISMLWEFTVGGSTVEALESMEIFRKLDISPQAFMGGTSLMGVVALPFILTILAFIWAGIIHLGLLLFGGSTAGFEGTFRAYAFATGSTAVFQAIPYVGTWVALVWGIVATVIAIQELHSAPTWKAVLVVLLPLILCCCCVALGMGTAFGTLYRLGELG